MAEIDDNKTTAYGNSDKNKTETYGNSVNTTAYNSNKEVTAAYNDLQNKEFKSRTHGIGVGDKLTLRNTAFTITEIISEGTGEAVIYKIENSSKQTLALKLYFEFSNSKEEPNYETLKRIKDIIDPDILKLYDFGVGADKYQGRYCYEISDFAEGGDLFSVVNFKEKYTKDFIEKSIVPEILNGIRKLHEFKIYHCDLKPSNIFYKDFKQTDLLIGDYGSAKAYDLETEKEIRKSSTVKGTDAYLPPEQARGIISEKNDYYSFGVILLHLLYPEQISSENDTRQVDKRKFEKIVERQYNSQPVVDLNQLYKRLNNLIEGLTLINHINRFGKNEVEKWLKGEEVEVKYKTTELSAVQPVKLGYATINNDKDLIHILETRETWWEDIFEDVDTYFALKAWLGSYHDITSRKIFDEMIHFYKPFGKEYIKESAIRYFEPNRDIQIDMTLFNFFTTDEIEKETKKFIRKIDDIWKITNKEKIKFYLFQFEFSLRQSKMLNGNKYSNTINRILERAFNISDLNQQDFYDYKTLFQNKLIGKNELEFFQALNKIFYSFDQNRTFKDLQNNSINSVEELAVYYIQNQEAFINKYLIIEKQNFLFIKGKTNLINLDYNEFIFSVFQKYKNFSIVFKKIEILTDSLCDVYFEYSESLNNFLRTINIDCKLISNNQRTDRISLSYNFFTQSHHLYNDFVTSLKIKYNLNDEALDVNELRVFKRDFSKIYRLVFNVIKKMRILPISFILGIAFYYIIQHFFNHFYPISEGVNLFWSYPFFMISGLAFLILAYGIIWSKLKQRKKFSLSISIVLFLSIFSFVIFNINLKNISKEFQYRYYLDSFNPILTQKYKAFELNELIDALGKRFPVRDATKYINRINYIRKGGNILLNSNTPLARTQFYDPGWLLEWQLKVYETNSSPFSEYLKCFLISLQNTKIKTSFSISLDAKINDPKSSVGIYIDNVITLLTQDEISIYKEEDFSDNAKKKVTKADWYYSIIAEDKNYDFRSGRHLSHTKPDFKRIQAGYLRPSGDTYLLTPVKRESAKILKVMDHVNLTIHVSGKNFQILVNGELIENRLEELRIPYVGLVFGFQSNLEIKSFVINEIFDNRHTESYDVNLLKPKIRNVDGDISLYEDKALKDVYLAQINENFELLYPNGNLMRVKSNTSNKLYFIQKDELRNIEFLK
jgi:serine/threonine protein kinase